MTAPQTRRELHDEPLAQRTTLGVGGSARRLIEVDREGDLIELLGELDEPFHLLGGGSNVVIADAGVTEPVLALGLRGVSERDIGDGAVELSAAAGESWDDLVAAAVDRGLVGIECLSGIPGLVGATPIQNVGAYGQQVSDRILEVRTFDLEAGTVATLAARACDFGYRDSLFKRAGRRRYVVLAVRFRLRRGQPDPPRYAQLERALATRGAQVTASALRQIVLELRRSKSMVLDEADPDSRSAGSFFLNPVVSPGQADRIARKALRDGLLTSGESMPRFDAAAGQVKLAAGWLIERAGFARGHTTGRAGLSASHALAIVNRGGASASEIIALARGIRDAVRDRFEVTLSPEPDLIGDFAGVDLGLAPLRPPLLRRCG